MSSKKASTAPPAEDVFTTPITLRTSSVGDALRWANARLSPSPTASLDSQLLMGHVIGRERSWVLAHGDEPLIEDAADRYRQLVSARAAGVPVAYLREYSEWCGMKLRVTPQVLVPRPETELLVEEAVAVARERQARYLVDVGTGSGAIAIQLARSLPDARVTGVDVSREALELARHNAESLGTGDRTEWLEGYLLGPVRSEPDLIVANLPYLSEKMMDELGSDVRHEPVLALRGGETGLELYRELFEERHDRGWRAPVLIEIDARQSQALSIMLRDEFSEPNVRVLQDYAGLDRIVVVGA
jgi:release factor glutamine methyltransferase